MSKIQEQKKAIELRRRGFSYSEILNDISASKSTLSLWLREIKLTREQTQRLIQKRLSAASKGAKKKREQRLLITNKIIDIAVKELGRLDRKIFWLVGVALYWAEGNKQKEHNISQGVKFSNSDPVMVKFFYKWLIEICQINFKDISFELYIHRGCDEKSVKIFWSKILELDADIFFKIRYKPNKFVSYRKNKGENYNGLIRINVFKSTNFNRKISGWIKGLCQQFKVD